MGNAEDYLDGLLNSVQDVRKDVARAEAQAEATRKQREEQRNHIMPSDDFMKASGLSDYNPEPRNHSNLRKAFSEEDFLRSFEEELGIEEEDEFIREFENEIARDEMAFDDSEDDIPEYDKEEKDDLTFLDNIENIVNQAKEQIEQGEIPTDIPDVSMDMDQDTIDEKSDEERIEAEQAEVSEERDEIQEDFANEETSNEDAVEDNEMGLKDEISENEEASDLGGAYGDAIREAGEDLLAKYASMEAEAAESGDEVSLIDGSDADLMDMLSEDAELGDIGDLLQADDEQIALEESQAEFDAQAAEEGDVNDLLAGLIDNEGAEEVVAEPKGLAGIIAKIKGIFKKKDDEEEVIDISKIETENLSQENLDILKNLDEAGEPVEEDKKDKKGKKEKKKKEKKPKEPKEKKEKKPKKEKVKKEKKPKEPDNSPKIPGKILLVFILLGASFVVFINLGQSAVGYKMAITSAQSAYEKQNYFDAYESLMGVELKESDVELFRKSRLLGDLQKRNQEYNVFMQKEMYAFALDALITGVGRYDENLAEAGELGIETEYMSQGDALVQLLSDQFGIDKEEAISMYHMNRETYSIKIDQVIEELNLD